MLKPGEQLRFAFSAMTKLNWLTAIASSFIGVWYGTGPVLVVITDQAVLLTAEAKQLWTSDACSTTSYPSHRRSDR